MALHGAMWFGEAVVKLLLDTDNVEVNTINGKVGIKSAMKTVSGLLSRDRHWLLSKEKLLIMRIVTPGVLNHLWAYINKPVDQTVVTSTDEATCVRLLRTSDYETHKNRNPNRIPGTCKWLLQHVNFQAWMRRETGLLWVSADPGCGKSVLAKSLIENELKSTEWTTCYFFFKDDNDEQKTACNALCGLLHQLLSRNPSLIKHAVPHIKDNGDKLPSLFETLWRILVAVADDPCSGEVRCVLDALDECMEKDRQRLIEKLSEYYQNPGKLRFLITSRPYSDIEWAFHSLTKNCPQIRLSGEDESEAISEEINLVIKHRTQEIGRRLHLESNVLVLLEERLLQILHRTYLWLHLTLAEFQVPGLEAEEVEELIQRLPESVYQAYELILSKVRGRDLDAAKDILHIVVAAARPLSLTEMSTTLKVRRNANLDKPTDEDVFRRKIRALCGLFVTIIDSKIYLIHQTAKEFLTHASPTLSRERTRWQGSVSLLISSTIMANICVKYLLREDFESTPLLVKQTSDDEAREQQSAEVYRYAAGHDLLEYAAQYWAEHFKASQPDENMVYGVVKLLNHKTRRFMTWFAVYTTLTEAYRDIDLGSTGFTFAAARGDESLFRVLLDSGREDVDTRTGDGSTPLHWAVRAGSETIVRLLLGTGEVDVNARSDPGRTALHWAARFGNVAILQMLLETGKVEIEARDAYDSTPLRVAVSCERLATVKVLLDNGAKVESLFKHGRTLLHIAASNGSEMVVEILLDHGIFVDFPDKFGLTPLFRAQEQARTAVCELLIRRGASSACCDKHGRLPQVSYERVDCDGCGIVIPELTGFHHCLVCEEGNFDLCELCFLGENACREEGHPVVEQQIRDGIIEDIYPRT